MVYTPSVSVLSLCFWQEPNNSYAVCRTLINLLYSRSGISYSLSIYSGVNFSLQCCCGQRLILFWCPLFFVTSCCLFLLVLAYTADANLPSRFRIKKMLLWHWDPAAQLLAVKEHWLVDDATKPLPHSVTYIPAAEFMLLTLCSFVMLPNPDAAPRDSVCLKAFLSSSSHFFD